MKLHIGNLPFAVGEEELKSLFADYNPDEILLIKNKFSGRSKGFGFVTIAQDDIAKKAIEEMNGKDLQGRQITVSEARPMEERPERSDRGDSDRPRRSFGGSSRGNFRGGSSDRGSFNNRRRF